MTYTLEIIVKSEFPLLNEKSVSQIISLVKCEHTQSHDKIWSPQVLKHKLWHCGTLMYLLYDTCWVWCIIHSGHVRISILVSIFSRFFQQRDVLRDFINYWFHFSFWNFKILCSSSVLLTDCTEDLAIAVRDVLVQNHLRDK